MVLRWLRSSREALALLVAVLLVGAAVVVSQHAAANEPGPTAKPSAVVAVSSSDRGAASRWWREAGIPGAVLVVPPASAPQCGSRTSAPGAGEDAIAEAVACSAGNPDRAVTASLRAAADDARATGAPLVLLGEGWLAAPPVPVQGPGDVSDVQRSISAAKVAGVIPPLNGTSVVLIGPAPDSGVKQTWDAYLAAAGAAEVRWVTV